MSSAAAAFRALFPYADAAVAGRLWEAGEYRKWANYLLVEFQLGRGHSWSLASPYWLTIDPTNFCQLQCPFCPTGAGRGVRDKASLKLEHFELLLARLGPAAIHVDMMNWGEPTLNKDVPAMIACAKRHRLEVRMDANLNDLSEAMAEGLVRSGLDLLSVSIDGVTPQTYGTYRVGGELGRVLDNVRRVAAKRRELGSSTPRLVWQFLVFKHNEHEIPRARQLAQELGMDEFNVVAPFLPNEPRVLAAWLPERGDYRRYAPPSPEEPAAAPLDVVRIQSTVPVRSYRARRFDPRQLRSLSYLLRRPRRDVWKRAWSVLRVAEEAAGATPFAGAPPQPVCKWPWAGMTVNPNGSVSPCCSVEDQGDDFGNALTGGLRWLWNNAAYRRARRHVRRYAQGRAGVQPRSDHVCERCTAIGYANFRFP